MASLRGSPQATAPSASASTNIAAKAGPQPVTPEAASISGSESSETMPEAASSSLTRAFSSSVTFSEAHSIVTPPPTATGMLGMMRTTG